MAPSKVFISDPADDIINYLLREDLCMKLLIFNGSPREGNTVEALKALYEGLADYPDIEVQEIKAADAHIIPCEGCDACMRSGDCIFEDDSIEINKLVKEADFLLFATPVYWWGVTAQLKLVMDKFYACHEEFMKYPKKVGTIVIGEAGLYDPQYEIIEKQFWCICDYLGWDKVFSKSYSANKPTDLHEQTESLTEIKGLAEIIHESR